jgi:hypothetical protein
MQTLGKLGYPCQLMRTGCLSALSALEANPAISRLPKSVPAPDEMRFSRIPCGRVRMLLTRPRVVLMISVRTATKASRAMSLPSQTNRIGITFDALGLHDFPAGAGPVQE